MQKKIRVGIIEALLAAFMIFCCLSCSRGGDSGQMETLTLSIPPLEQNALLYVAESQGMFSRNGLKIIIKDFDSGVTSINAMLQGETDIAGSAEFPFVRVALQKEQVRIIACNDRFENDYILARKDRGIATISDLKGKRIGVTLKTINEFYLGRFLSLHGLKLKDVSLVDISPAQFTGAITGEDIDAIIAWQPYINQIQKKLSGTVVWPAQSSQAVYGVLVTRGEWLSQHASLVERFLRSLKEAEDYLVRYPEAARAIVQKRLNYENGYMDSVWSKHQFALSLELSLIIAMNDEARWMIADNLSPEKTIPDFKDYIYLDGLQAVKPEAVNILR
jgi:NitT/TauT family transport system substrate-binding protein